MDLAQQQLTSDRQRMGAFASRIWLKTLAWACAAVVIGLNVVLIGMQMNDWAQDVSKDGGRASIQGPFRDFRCDRWCRARRRTPDPVTRRLPPTHPSARPAHARRPVASVERLGTD